MGKHEKDVYTRQTLYREATMEKRDKLYTSKTDSELDKLKRDFDFFGYLKKRNGAVKYDTSRYAMFENCEICGHHEDLSLIHI